MGHNTGELHHFRNGCRWERHHHHHFDPYSRGDRRYANRYVEYDRRRGGYLPERHWRPSAFDLAIGEHLPIGATLLQWAAYKQQLWDFRCRLVRAALWGFEDECRPDGWWPEPDRWWPDHERYRCGEYRCERCCRPERDCCCEERHRRDYPKGRRDAGIRNEENGGGGDQVGGEVHA